MSEQENQAGGSRDTIEVREEERFDPERLKGYLLGRLEGAEGPLMVRQFAGGAANLTYELSFGNRHYVLRRPPLGRVAPTSHDMKREHTVLSVLYKSFPPAPRALLYCDDAEVIGAPFLVMERCRGLVVRRRMPTEFLAIPNAPQRMSSALVRTLADFHSVDYAELGLEKLGKPKGFIRRQVEGWQRRWRQARLQDVPEMEVVSGWLRDHVPASSRFSLVHNDYKLDNVMFARDDPGRITAVLDWDMCTLGDPLSDLGSVLAYWSSPSDAPDLRAMAMMPREGFPNRGELVSEYCRLSGCERVNVPFYHVLGLFRLAVIVAQIYYRYRRGQTQDPRFGAFGALVPVLASAALDVQEGKGL